MTNKTNSERIDCLDNSNKESCSKGGLRQGFCEKHYRRRKLVKSSSRLYNIWQGMKSRCLNPNDSQFKYYGAIGRSICTEWISSFDCFESWSLENGYTDSLTLDRLDNSGNYEPLNCAWRSRKEQSRNSSVTRQMTIFKETKSVIEWSEDPRCEVAYSTIIARLFHGQEIDESLIKTVKDPELSFTLKGETKTLREWSNDPRCKISYEGLVSKLRRGNLKEDTFLIDTRRLKRSEKWINADGS